MGVVIRDAARADVPGILAIYNDAVLHTTASYDDEPSTLEARLDWFDAKGRHGLPVLVAADETGVVGWSSFGPFRPWPGYRHTVEHSVYVAAARRGQGIGSALLPTLIARAREMGLHAMVAGIDAANAPSLRLHARLGFERVAHFKEVGFKFDRWLDLVFMELLLGDSDGRPGHIGRGS
jgi:L-amino acid N-acyltransferase YncA